MPQKTKNTNPISKNKQQYIMKQTRTKYGDNATVINALQAQGAWPVATTVQIYETARAHGFGYVGAAEVFMTNKVGRGKWDVSAVDASGSTSNQASSTKRVKKVGKPVLSSATPVLKKKGKVKETEQSWPEGTKILKEDGEPDTIVVDTVREAISESQA